MSVVVPQVLGCYSVHAYRRLSVSLRVIASYFFSMRFEAAPASSFVCTVDMSTKKWNVRILCSNCFPSVDLRHLRLPTINERFQSLRSRIAAYTWTRQPLVLVLDPIHPSQGREGEGRFYPGSPSPRRRPRLGVEKTRRTREKAHEDAW